MIEAYFPTLPKIELFARGRGKAGVGRVGERGRDERQISANHIQPTLTTA